MKHRHWMKKILPKHLLMRFVLIILLPLIIAQSLVGIYFYHKHWDAISRRLADDILNEVGVIANWVERQDNPENDLAVLSNSFGFDLSWQANNKLPPTKTKSHFASATLQSKMQSLKYPQSMQPNNAGGQEIYIQLSRGLLKVVVPQKRFFSTTVPSFLWWMLGSSILLFGIAFIFMKNQVRAIVRLAKASELFGMGQEIRFKPEGAEEVRQAGLAFIEMKDRITRYLSDRTAMLAGVSHDLRTPLTRMKLELSMIEPDETTQMLNQDIDEMEHMLTGYLDFARGAGKEAIEKINLGDFLTTLVDKYKRVGFAVSLHLEQNATIMARPHEFMRALSNLVSNAQHYATKTHILVGRRDNTVQLIIDDNGPGIPRNKRTEVFKPFYRVDPARNQNTAGVGLGMTIARDTILSLGGNIQLESSPMKGLRIIITLPVEK